MSLETHKENLNILDLGLVNYQEALDLQIELAQKIAQENSIGTLIVCTHPPIVTLGRKTEAGDVFGWPGEILEVARGGRATYHGPSQIICYPLVNLRHERKGRRPQEVWGLIRAIEGSIISALATLGLIGEGKSFNDETGVWVNSKKIASVGIGVKNWVSIHGLALNVEHDPKAFVGLNPCGLQSSVMTSVEEQLRLRNGADFLDDEKALSDVGYQASAREKIKDALIESLLREI